MMNTVRISGTSASARLAASSSEAPAPMASAARHRAHVMPNEMVPVSTERTGTATSRAAMRALFNVPEYSLPTCTERISVAPRSITRS